MLPDGRVFVFGGSAAGGLVEEAELYDPVGRRFEAGAKLEPRAYHTARLMTDGRVLLAGGVDRNGELVKRLETWDPVSGTMETLDRELAQGVKGYTARLQANGNVLVGSEEVGPATVALVVMSWR